MQKSAYLLDLQKSQNLSGLKCLILVEYKRLLSSKTKVCHKFLKHFLQLKLVEISDFGQNLFLPKTL